MGKGSWGCCKVVKGLVGLRAVVALSAIYLVKLLCPLFCSYVDGINIVAKVSKKLLNKTGSESDITALTIAIEMGHLGVTDALIKGGVDVNKKSTSLTSPIHLAIFLGERFFPQNLQIIREF